LRETLICLIVKTLYCNGAVYFENNGYEDLLVAISPDVPQNEESTVIENIKVWLTEGSASLHKATHGWAKINSVKILLPSSWSYQANEAVTEDFESAEIQVQLPSSIYGEGPYTRQNGGCGDSGDNIQVGYPFIQKGIVSETYFGPLGQVFVHEWSKYRYGVFEEFGYPGDPLYPMYYYKQSWTATGQTNVLTPNFCTNIMVEGDQYDLADQDESCSFDESNGLPNKDCLYLVTGPANIKSSIMAVPYLEGNTQYSEDNEDFIHHPDIPTKHNAKCDGRSVFSVVLDHPDFVGYSNIHENENITMPKFEVIKPRDMDNLPYVFVLDASNSMQNPKPPAPASGTRINRLKVAATRFLLAGAKDGMPIGAVRFSDNTPEALRVIYDIKKMNDSTKQELADAINDLELSLQTCIGDALNLGLETLKNYGTETGGVIMLITDGQFVCKNDPSHDIAWIMPTIKERGVRVITVAIGPSADFTLEQLAAETNGLSYFVPDGSGPDYFNAAFDGSLAFQPVGQITEKEVEIFTETYSSQKIFNTSFEIDQFSGKDVKMSIDVTTSESFIAQYTVTNNDGFIDSGYMNDSFTQIAWEDLNPGTYKVQYNATIAAEFITLQVTSRTKENILPLFTECWSSIGEEYLNLESATPDKLAIMAKVTQGYSPVVNAKVSAIIEADGKEPILVTLHDNGQEPDNVKGDGIYSRYFTQFESSDTEVRLSLTCKVEGQETTEINNGPASQFKKKSLPSDAEYPICCGSTAVNEDSVLEPTGSFTRSGSGGAIGVAKSSNMNDNLYPPGKVNDLLVKNLDFEQRTFQLSFTSPGQDLDQGEPTEFAIFYSTNMTLLSNDDSLYDSTQIKVLNDSHIPGDNSSFPTPLPPSEVLIISVDMDSDFVQDEQTYFRLQATDDGDLFSLSNIARIYLTDTSSGNRQVSGFMTIFSYFIYLVFVK